MDADKEKDEILEVTVLEEVIVTERDPSVEVLLRLGVFDGLMMLPGDDVEMLGLVLIDEMNALELVLVRVEEVNLTAFDANELFVDLLLPLVEVNLVNWEDEDTGLRLVVVECRDDVVLAEIDESTAA